MIVSPFKYATISKVSDVVVKDDIITLNVCSMTPDKPVALALFAGSIPITYVKVRSDPALCSAIADGKFYGKSVISGACMAYGLSDAPTLQCARSKKTLATLPPLLDEVVKVKPPLRQVSVSDLVLELDTGHVSNIDELIPYALEFYRERGKVSFIEAVYRMFLKRHPEEGIIQRKMFDENNLQGSLISFIRETFESEEARQSYIRRVPGPSSEDFLFRL